MKIIVVDRQRQDKNFVEILFSDKIPQSKVVAKNNKEFLEIKTPKKEEMNRRKWIILVRAVAQEAKKNRIKNIIIDWKKLTDFDDIGTDLAQLFTENILMADYEFRKYKKKPKEGWDDIVEVQLVAGKKEKTSLQLGIKKGMLVAKEINFCRDLVNTPGADMTPEILVRETKKAIRGTKIKMKVLEQGQMKQKKMGGILAVGGGSQCKPKFIILEYKGGAKTKKPIVLVGKGVTFDSGGIDTKPHPYALDMMMDMSGGAAVISAIIVAEKLKLKKNIVALIPAVENMPSGTSFRPGDIVRMMDGTTVEVGHTDAEGRLILADALTCAKSFDPEIVIDVATLTGAALSALGERASAIFSSNDDLIEKTVESSEEVGDYVWRMPLWEEYEAEIKGTHGDISNINTKAKPGYGGAITAATFLKHFAQKHKSWMHIDIAPKMTAVFDENLAKGAVGAPVRLLVRLLEKL